MKSTSMKEPVFRIDYRVLYADTDAGGVVYHAGYLRFFEIGRTEMMREWVIANSEIERMGFILPVTETWLRYKVPARYDDLISIESSLVDVKKYTCRFNYRILRADAEKSTLLVKGFTVHACVSQKGRLSVFPEVLIERLHNTKFRGETT